MAQREFGTLLSNSNVCVLKHHVTDLELGENHTRIHIIYHIHIQGSLQFLCDFLFCLCYANGWGGILDVNTQADEKFD